MPIGRLAVYLAVGELIRAHRKDELKGLLWRVLFWAMRNECVSKLDVWGAWQGYILKEVAEDV